MPLYRSSVTGGAHVPSHTVAVLVSGTERAAAKTVVEYLLCNRYFLSIPCELTHLIPQVGILLPHFIDEKAEAQGDDLLMVT